MKVHMDQIIQKIQDQTNLSREEIVPEIQRLKMSLKPEEEFFDDDSPFLKLLAQELNVDLEDPTDYLYTELIFDQWPLFVRIIPFATIDKEKIVITLNKLMLKLEKELRRRGERKPLIDYEPSATYSERIFDAISHWSTPSHGTLFICDGILANFDFYSNHDLGTFSLETIVHQATLLRTFSDYQIVRSADSSKVYLPYSLVHKTFHHPPDWASVDGENREGWLQFSYISLASLELFPDLEGLNLGHTCAIEIIDTDALRHCPQLTEIALCDFHENVEQFAFPSHLPLPHLELLEIVATHLQFLDLSFLRDCVNISHIHIASNRRIKKITLPPFDKHALLHTFDLNSNHLTSLELFPPWNCPHLHTVNLYYNQLEHFDLSTLSTCSNLQVINLGRNQLTYLDLTPLRQCTELQDLSLHRNNLTTIDLTPLQSCLHLQKLNLSDNRLKTIDLTPLTNHQALREVHLDNNLLEAFDPSPLEFCPNLELLNLQNNPCDQ